MMELLDVVVGEGEWTYKDIVDILLKESVASKTSTEWRTLARELNIAEHKIKKWDQERTLNQKTINDIFVDVLTEWRFSTGATATLGDLVARLKKIKWNAVAEEFSNAFQNKSTALVSESQRLPDTIPHKLSYYVPRRLLANNRISVTALTSAVTSNNVYVFIGISYEELSVLVNKLARSGEMIRTWDVGARYIFLEQDEDWQKLCEKREESLHLVQFENGSLICLRSHGEREKFRTALINKGDKKEFTEEEFLTVVNETENQKLKLNIPVCIADSPGMGKSVLLSELGRQLKEKCNDREVAYIVITEYIESIKKSHETKFEDIVKSTLIDKLSGNQILREKLELDFHSNKKSTVTKYEFLFDGFDEIKSQDFKMGYKCVKELEKCLRHCARLWVTTRRHLLGELENCLGVCGYRILPFNGTDKLNFLINYWSPEDTKAVQNRRLKEFGETCLTAVESKLNDNERDFLGIPLLCKLLGEVYETKARALCVSNDADDTVAKPELHHFKINSITALYESFIANRIRKGLGINENNKEIFEESYVEAINQEKDLHVFLSMELIFPSEMTHLLSPSPINDFKCKKKEKKLLKIGIVEAMSMKDEPRFLHRTIAEYFVAKFLVDSIPEKSTEEISRFFFEILSSNYYPNIRYFVDCLLRQNPQKYHTNLNITFPSSEATGSLIDALTSLIESDLVNIFKLFHVVFNEELSHQRLQNAWIYKIVKKSSVEMINFIYEYYDDLPIVSKLNPSDVSVLEESIERGDVDKFIYLLHDHGYYGVLCRSKFSELRQCLETCIEGTASINQETHLQHRIQIFSELMNIKTTYFKKETVHAVCKLLTFSKIHSQLLLELLRYGIGLVETDVTGKMLYLEIASRNDTLTLKCFLRAFAEGIWNTSVRLKIREESVLIRYMENDISLHDLKEIPLLCLLLSEVEEKVEEMVDSLVSSKFPSQKRCKVLNIVTIHRRLMQQLSGLTYIENTESNLENLQILLAFKFLAIDLPSEVELDLTADFKNQEIYKLYKSKVAKLKEVPNSSITVTNVDVVAQCLVADYILNTLSHNSCSSTVTFLFQALLRVTSTKWHTHGGKYLKNHNFVHQDLCHILDKSLSKRNEPTIASLVKVESYLFDILAASLCQNFKNIFSRFLDIIKSTLRSMAEVSSHLEGACVGTYSPLNCYKLIDRIPNPTLILSEIKREVFKFEEFVLLVAMQEETVDYDMLKTIFAGGVDINSKDETGFSLLDYAVKKKRFDIANILLRLGAKFRAEDTIKARIHFTSPFDSTKRNSLRQLHRTR